MGNFCLFLSKLKSNSSLVLFSEIHQSRMAITWREHENEEEDLIALHDPVTVNALRNCGLQKFFCISSMRQKINLLQYWLDVWDPTSQVFHIRGKSIPLTVEDIYFLTGLSRRGALIYLSGPSHGGDSVRDYVHRYYREGSQPGKDGKIIIRDVTDRSLRTILFTIGRMVGSAPVHAANRSYMQYALECLEPKVFNWCD